MNKKIVYFLVLVLVIPIVFAGNRCITPYNGMKILRDMTLCSGVYYLEDGISVAGSNIKLDCNGAVLTGNFKKTGITIEQSENISITKCQIMFYFTGMHVKNVTKANIIDNNLIRNMDGMRLNHVTNSAVLNQDISFQDIILVYESTNNAISSYNRFIEGDFCEYNYCNMERSFVEFYQDYAKPVKKKYKKSLIDILLEGLFG